MVHWSFSLSETTAPSPISVGNAGKRKPLPPTLAGGVVSTFRVNYRRSGRTPPAGLIIIIMAMVEMRFIGVVQSN